VTLADFIASGRIIVEHSFRYRNKWIDVPGIDSAYVDLDEYVGKMKADLSKYSGKYIAIVGNRVVTSGENAKEVWKTAKEKYPDKTPSLAKVPKEELLILLV